MRTIIISECGYYEALLGMGLSHGVTSELHVDEVDLDWMGRVASRLAGQDGGHNKFLESIQVWLDVTAPLFWWIEFDTYRVGTTKQSESTMHTLKKTALQEDHFEYPVPNQTLQRLNALIENDQPIQLIKNELPTGFLQRRIVSTNYKTLRNIILQRRKHRLPQWTMFCGAVLRKVEHPELLPKLKDNKENDNAES